MQMPDMRLKKFKKFSATPQFPRNPFIDLPADCWNEFSSIVIYQYTND